MAVQLAAERTGSANLLVGLARAYTGKEYLDERAANQFDVVGDTSPSAVANSLWHYGTDVRVFIEDQPLWRGGIGGGVTAASLDYGDIKLLVDGYGYKDFGDTHSLVLIVDSLTVQNTLLQLLPEEQRASAESAETLKDIFRKASYLEAKNGDLVSGTDQGKTEGNVLENIVSALGSTLLGPEPEQYRALVGNPNGGTWAKLDDMTNGTVVYTGRDEFHKTLQSIVAGDAYQALQGKLTLSASSAALKNSARDDFTAFAAIYSLSPFRIGSSDSEELEAVLGAAWGETYTDWKADRSLTTEALAEGKAKFSETWLADRSAFLGHWLTAGELNVDIELFSNAVQTPSNDTIWRQAA